MKKWIVGTVAVMAVLFLAGVALAGSYTNKLGQIFTVTVGDSGVTVTTTSTPGAGATDTKWQVNAIGAQIATGTVSATEITNAYTPRAIGDILIWPTSNIVWMATSTTRWMRLDD